MSKRRVAVTGLGILSPLGNDLRSSWDGIVHGRSGIGPITHFDASAFPTRIAGEVKDFDATQWVAPCSAPPATITSASPYWIMRIAMPIEWFDVAQAETAEKLGPFRPFWMLSCPGSMLMIVLGT